MPLNQVPQPGQTLLVTRNPINQNWTTINNGFLQDHVELGVANAGKHKTIHLVNQGVAPAAPTTGANEVGLYAAPGYPNNGAPALYFKRQNSAANVDGIDFTTFGSANPGWCRLPCGILLKWGSPAVTGNRDNRQVVVFPVAANIPAFNTIFSVQVTCGENTVNDGNIQLFLTAITNINFTVWIRKIDGAQNVTANVYYLAIGI